MFTDPPRNIAEAMQQGYEERLIRERMNGPMGGGGAAGGGVGNIAGWALFSGMIFSVVGFIMGKDLTSAIVGGLFGAALLWVPAAFLRKTDGGASRFSVIAWTLGGLAGGAALAIAVALVADVIFLKEMRVGNMIVNYGILGALVLGGYRLSRR